MLQAGTFDVELDEEDNYCPIHVINEEEMLGDEDSEDENDSNSEVEVEVIDTDKHTKKKARLMQFPQRKIY